MARQVGLPAAVLLGYDRAARTSLRVRAMAGTPGSPGRLDRRGVPIAGNRGSPGHAPIGPPPLSVTTLTSEEAFESLGGEWNGLLAASAGDSICLTWEWLWTWWQVFGRNRSLLLLAVREAGGRLAGLAPLAARCIPCAPGATVRRLELLGTGEPPADAIWSERLDIIARHGVEAAVVAAVAVHLATTLRARWDEIHFTNTLDGSLAAAVARDLGRRGLATRFVDVMPSLYVRLPADPDDVPAMLRPRRRRALRRYVRKLDAGGGVAMHACSDPAEFDARMEDLIALHQRRWTARGERGVFASARFHEFHRRLAPVLLASGKLVLYTLSLGNRTVGVLYGFAHGRTVSGYQAGLDVTLDPTISLGLVAYSLWLREAVRAGFSEWDFMRGDEPYKRLWSADSRAYVDAHAWNRGAMAVCARARFLARHAAKSALGPMLAGLRRWRRATRA